ncbi:Ribosomal RNA small subunit methyltransferase E [Synechocystis sp. PCC 6714]|nr:Ribosomal RNA small subunit methyltransferase E [Synechocystis sp. PCC 6714]
MLAKAFAGSKSHKILLNAWFTALPRQCQKPIVQFVLSSAAI